MNVGNRFGSQPPTKRPQAARFAQGQQIEVRYKRETVMATCLHHPSANKIYVKINKTGEKTHIIPSNVRVVMDPPQSQADIDQYLTPTEQAEMKELIEEEIRKKKGPGRPRGRPRKHPLPTDRNGAMTPNDIRNNSRAPSTMSRSGTPAHRAASRTSRAPTIEANGKILISEEQAEITIPGSGGRRAMATVKKYSDGTQTVSMKRSQMDTDTFRKLKDSKHKNNLQKSVRDAVVSSMSNRPDSVASNFQSSKSFGSQNYGQGDNRYQLSNLHKQPPCSFPIYDSSDTVFINHKNQLHPKVVCEDFLKPVMGKFEKSTKGNIGNKRAMFSMSSVINTGVFDQLELDPKWAENRQFRLIDEELTNLSDQQFVENTRLNPIVKDILNNKECQNNTTLQKLRAKVNEMNLDELADVLLPVLVERLSPADILISQSRDGSTENKVDLQKMEQNLSRCKRQLTWIKNNSKNIEEYARLLKNI